ncbi:MAG: recombinase family protein [Hungatella sp.]|uniref:recombinase family protein n=1 Tax=Hungatella sp. TaxID=2613924 RepID=UPI003990F8EC
MSGKGNVEIARVLNEKKYPTPGTYKRLKGGFGYGLKQNQESIWDSMKILSILRDERCKGTLIIGRYQSAGIEAEGRWKRRKHHGFRKEHAIPAIISAEDFETIQKMHPNRKRGKYRKEHHLLYRKIKCGCCGRYLYYKPSGSWRAVQFIFL